MAKAKRKNTKKTDKEEVVTTEEQQEVTTTEEQTDTVDEVNESIETSSLVDGENSNDETEVKEVVEQPTITEIKESVPQVNKIEGDVKSVLKQAKKYEDIAESLKDDEDLKDMINFLNLYFKEAYKEIVDPDKIANLNYSFYIELNKFLQDKDYSKFKKKMDFLTTIFKLEKDKRMNELNLVRYDYLWKGDAISKLSYQAIITSIVSIAVEGNFNSIDKDKLASKLPKDTASRFFRYFNL